MGSRNLGSVLNAATSGLRTVGETTNAAGQTVRRLQDASGAILEVTLDAAGRVVNSRVVRGASGAATGATGSLSAPR